MSNRARHSIFVIGIWVALIAAACFLMSNPSVYSFFNSTGSKVNYEEEYMVLREALKEISVYVDEIDYAAEELIYGASGAWVLLTGQDPDYDPEEAVEEIEDSWDYYSQIERNLSLIKSTIDMHVY